MTLRGTCLCDTALRQQGNCKSVHCTQEPNTSELNKDIFLHSGTLASLSSQQKQQSALWKNIAHARLLLQISMACLRNIPYIIMLVLGIPISFKVVSLKQETLGSLALQKLPVGSLWWASGFWPSVGMASVQPSVPLSPYVAPRRPTEPNMV